MALINCPECNKEISSEANSCPNCGYNIKKQKRKQSAKSNKGVIIFVVCIIILILGIFAFDRIMDATHTNTDEALEAFSKHSYNAKQKQDELNDVNSQLDYYKYKLDKYNN